MDEYSSWIPGTVVKMNGRYLWSPQDVSSFDGGFLVLMRAPKGPHFPPWLGLGKIFNEKDKNINFDF